MILRMTIVHGRDTCRDDGYIRLTVINGVVNCEFLKSNEDTPSFGRTHVRIADQSSDRHCAGGPRRRDTGRDTKWRRPVSVARSRGVLDLLRDVARSG